MEAATLRALDAINRRFYRIRAEAFAARRQRAWPGWDRVLSALPRPPDRVLDLGCGHGRLAAFLAERGCGQAYLGIDSSAELLERAAGRSDGPPAARWLCLDLLREPRALPAAGFELVALFGVLHHLPGEARRRRLLEEAASRVAPGGALAVSFWRFSRQARGERLRLPWESVGVDPAALEAGDALLSFDGDTSVPRYCHEVDQAEAHRLLDDLGLEPRLAFQADGGWNDYQVLARAQCA